VLVAWARPQIAPAGAGTQGRAVGVGARHLGHSSDELGSFRESPPDRHDSAVRAEEFAQHSEFTIRWAADQRLLQRIKLFSTTNQVIN
jgi:hypothetical protein